METDKDLDGKISFEEFTKMVENTDVSMSMTLGMISLLSPAIGPSADEDARSQTNFSSCHARNPQQLLCTN